MNCIVWCKPNPAIPIWTFCIPVHFISSLLQLPPPLRLLPFQPPDITSIMIPLDPRGGGGVLATLFLCLAPSVLAHGDHGHNVPEGSAVSEDPIVCCCQTLYLDGGLIRGIGLDIMDSYDSDGVRVWYHLSVGYGSGGMLCFLVSRGDRRQLLTWVMV